MIISITQTIKIVIATLVVSLLLACNSELDSSTHTVTTQAVTTHASITHDSTTHGPTSQVSAEASTSNISLLTVYKSPSCGCCEGWIEHAIEHGFATKALHPDDLYGVKQSLNIPQNMQSCHTVVTKDGLVFEGHVPVKFINQFIANIPANAIGLSVPGMVVGTPGMEVDDKFRAYKIFQLNKDGSTVVYAEINSYQQQF